MNEYQLNRQQRDNISIDDLAMLIMRVLQRNHRERGKYNWHINYYPYQMSSILAFEIVGGEEVQLRGIEPAFKDKFAEAVHRLQHGGFIMQDPSQTHAPDFQSPTSRGLQVDTTVAVLGITSGEEFIGEIEAQAGTLDNVSKAYLMESYAAAESNLWLSSMFMLGAASERLIYVLSERIDCLLADPTASVALNNINSVRQRKEWIISHLPALRKKYPAHREAFSDVEDKFDTLYSTYRYQRNEVGHPRDTPFNPDVQQAKTMLFSFGIYARSVNVIIAIP